jgi:hypothetical protein
MVPARTVSSCSSRLVKKNPHRSGVEGLLGEASPSISPAPYRFSAPTLLWKTTRAAPAASR